MCLNELHDYMLQTLPPTDSRLRPDVRILEQGNIGRCLNELHDYMLQMLPPTDSRLRPDVRILEQGNIGRWEFQHIWHQA